MNRYEVLVLAIPEITSDETATIEKEFEKSVQKAGGSIISFERWGKLRLAYPIDKNDYGIYLLSRFEVDDANKDDLLKAIRSLFTLKYNNLVMRFMTCKLDPAVSLEYERPESLEDVPTRDVGQFLRENKMEGLLTTKAAPEAASAEVVEAKTAASDEQPAPEVTV